MFTILFWNVNGKNLSAPAARIAAARLADIVLLAEAADPLAYLNALNADAETGGFFLLSSSSRLTWLARVPDAGLPVVREKTHYSIRRLPALVPVRSELLVIGVHLPSKRHQPEESKGLPEMARRLARAIRRAERDAGHTNTVVVGDFNMNPFEEGMASASGLHGLMTRELAEREPRTVLGQRYRAFYNPMWQAYGRRLGGVPGTCFYSTRQALCYFWNVFDQVLVRPTLLDRVGDDAVTIVDNDGTGSMLTPAGRPSRDRYSDHLPLVVRLDQ